MRITTQMLNQSAKRSGLDLNRPTLLDYMRNKGAGNALFSALSKSRQTNISTIKSTGFEKLDKEADKLTQSAQNLLEVGDKGIFEQAKISGNNQKIYDNIENMFDGYNDTLKALRNGSGTLNDFYRKMLVEASEEMKDSLEEHGITFDKDGTASVHMKKVKEMDFDTLEKLFGKDSDFVEKVEFISSRISDNAKANIESLGRGYSAKGNMHLGNGINRYDYRG